MKFIPLSQARGLNYDDTYLVELKDGTHALGQLVSVQKNHKTFKVINFSEKTINSEGENVYQAYETADVVKVAKLPKKGQVEDEQKDPAV
jgi:hypothetical protein